MATPEAFRVKRKRVSAAGAKRKRAEDADAADAAPAPAAATAAAPTPAVPAAAASTEPAAKKRAAAAAAAQPKAAPAAPVAAYPTAHVSQPVVWEAHAERHINLQRFFEAVINAEVDACKAAFTGADRFVADELETALSHYKSALIDKLLVPNVQALRHGDDLAPRPHPRDEEMRAKLQLLTHLHDKVVQETAAWDALKLAWEARAKAAAAATTTAAAQSSASSVGAAAAAATADPLKQSSSALRAALSKEDVSVIDTDHTGALQNDMERAFKAFSTRSDRIGLMLTHMQQCVEMAQNYKDKIATAVNASVTPAAATNPAAFVRTLLQNGGTPEAAAAAAGGADE